MATEQTGGQICETHGLPATRLRPCIECVRNPKPVVVEQAATDDAETLASEKRVREMRERLSETLDGFIGHREKMKSQDSKGVQAAVKLAETILKCERLEFDLREPRLKREHERSIARDAKKVRGVH